MWYQTNKWYHFKLHWVPFQITLILLSSRRSLSLIEILLRAAEEGFYTEVMEIFGVPIKQCPEVLCLGLVQFEVSHESTLICSLFLVCIWSNLILIPYSRGVA